jgi:hypothetical protein
MRLAHVACQDACRMSWQLECLACLNAPRAVTVGPSKTPDQRPDHCGAGEVVWCAVLTLVLINPRKARGEKKVGQAGRSWQEQLLASWITATVVQRSAAPVGMRARPVRPAHVPACSMQHAACSSMLHAGEVHAGEVHAGEVHAGEVHAGEVHVYEVRRLTGARLLGWLLG